MLGRKSRKQRNAEKSTKREPSTPPMHDHSAEAPQNPIIGLQVIPTGPRYLFDDFIARERGDHYFLIGSSDECDIQLKEPTISAVHCAIVRRYSRVFVNDMGSTNGTWIGGKPVSSCELHEGSVMVLGTVNVAVIGREQVAQNVVIAASTLWEFLQKAREAHGSIRAAADAIGISYSTLRKWLLTKGPFEHDDLDPQQISD